MDRRQMGGERTEGEGGARAVIDKPNGSERIAVESRTCMSDEAITVRKTPQL